MIRELRCIKTITEHYVFTKSNIISVQAKMFFYLDEIIIHDYSYDFTK